MVRTIKIPADQLAIRGDKLELSTTALPGRVLNVSVEVDDEMPANGQPHPDPATMPFEEWARNFHEILALAPINEYPCDDSREAMYGPDPEENEPA
mgnify:CR=1 FL=1